MSDSRTHPSRQPEPRYASPGLPVYDISIREILDRFSQDAELLKAVLKAKSEELKLRAEEIQYQSERVRLEIKRLDNESIKDETSFVNWNNHLLPFSSSTVNKIEPSQNLNHFQRERNSFDYNCNSSYICEQNRYHDKDEQDILPPLYHNIELNRTNSSTTSTIILKEAPAHQPKRQLSREKVMEALRSKVRHNTSNQTKSNSGGPMLAPINSNFTNHNIHVSQNQASSLPTDKLSTIQPQKDSTHIYHPGPFSAPVGSPHSAFQFPPPNKYKNSL